MVKKQSERNHLQTPVDIAAETAMIQTEEIFENILGKPKKPKPTVVAGQPVDDIIEELSKLLPGG
jgi:6-phosphogluconate dehydrogenase